MLEKPFQLVSKVFRGVQHAAARIANAADRKADTILENRAYRARHRPSTRFIREVRHGRMAFAIYERTNRAGEVHRYWTLNRHEQHGRMKLATGTLGDLREIRAIVREVLDQSQGRQPVAKAELAPRQERRLEERQQPERRRELERQPRQVEKKPWYALVQLGGPADGDGAVKARVIKNYPSVKKAMRAQAENPSLAVCGVPFPEPRRRGAIITVAPGEIQYRKVAISPREVARQLENKLEGMARGRPRAEKPEAERSPEASRRAAEAPEEGRRPERGPSHVVGIWHDKKTVPKIGDMVNFSKEDRRVIPLGTGEPGEGKTRLYVVLKGHPTVPNLYRVAETSRREVEAESRARELSGQSVNAARANKTAATPKASLEHKQQRNGLSL